MGKVTVLTLWFLFSHYNMTALDVVKILYSRLFINISKKSFVGARGVASRLIYSREKDMDGLKA